ncbi:ROK family protein [Aquipuribacter sp. SD81]|uniref:ROK family protein n=1 Tax=Aquipuribacter sp. SD81 TaxID=3127703 RepID=UPI00301B52D1
MALTTSPGTPGPPPAAHGPATAALGLDVGASKVHGVVLVDGAVRAERRTPSRPGLDGVVASVTAVVAALAADVPDLAAPGWAGVGVGVPGVVDPRTGTVGHAVNLGVSAPVPLRDALSAALGAPVVVGNDVDAAALGAAHTLGLGPGADLAYLSLGTGLAAGLLLDGRLRRGGGAAGEVGHVPYRPDGPRCACGQHGCLELYASGSALQAAWPDAGGAPAAAAVFRRAAAGDPRAVAVREAFLDAVATAAQTLVLTVDVAHVVLGGGVAALGEPLRAGVSAVLARRAAGSPFLAALDLPGRIRLAPDGRVAPVGAALAALASPA